MMRSVFVKQKIKLYQKKGKKERNKLNCGDTIEQKHSMNFLLFCGWLSIT